MALDWVYITVQSKGTQIPYNDNLTVGMIDEGVKAFGQLIFDIKPYNTKVTNGFPATIQIQYNLEGKSQGEIQISASAYSVTDNLSFYKDPATINSYFATIMTENLNSSPTPIDIKFEQVFNYRAEIQNYSISYIVCRVTEMYPKFLKDHLFDLVFINSELAIFKAKG